MRINLVLGSSFGGFVTLTYAGDGEHAGFQTELVGGFAAEQ